MHNISICDYDYTYINRKQIGERKELKDMFEQRVNEGSKLKDELK